LREARSLLGSKLEEGVIYSQDGMTIQFDG
jgi:hypothetical protein